MKAVSFVGAALRSAKIYLFGPVHAHEAMHLAQMHHLSLSCIPQLVMSRCLLELLPEAYTTEGELAA